MCLSIHNQCLCSYVTVLGCKQCPGTGPWILPCLDYRTGHMSDVLRISSPTIFSALSRNKNISDNTTLDYMGGHMRPPCGNHRIYYRSWQLKILYTLFAIPSHSSVNTSNITAPVTILFTSITCH